MSLTRRTTLKSMLSGMALAAMPGLGHAAARKIPWKNWAGTESCFPSARATPKTLDELVDIIRKSTGVIRPVGAGHSWAPLVPTDGTILSLRKFKGLIDHDPNAMTARIGAGTKLSATGPILDEISQAMFNLPDIDEQSMAGAFATGTHGTGLHLPALHQAVESLTLVAADGQVYECSRSKHAELFDAARVSLGSLGVITDYTLKNVAPYNLKRVNWIETLENLLEEGEGQALAEKHRHFEFWYMPFSDYCYCQSSDITDEPVTGRPPDEETSILEDMRKVRDLLGFSNTLRSMALKAAVKLTDMPPSYIDRSWITLTNERAIPIYEMEYQLPLENGPAAMREIVDYIESNYSEMFVPLEYRYVDADDAWLSEYYGRQCVSISVHRYREEGVDPWEIYTPVQEIFLKYGGRPHWGKVHNLKADQLRALYPKFDDFKQLRQEMDPQGRFANAHIRQVFAMS